MKKSQYLKKFLISSLALVMVVTSLTQMAIHANAQNNFDINGEKVYINSLDDLIEVAKASRGIGKYADDPMKFEGQYLYLENDITITEDDVERISQSDLQVLTIGGIGNEPLPFMGIFDGQGHTITGLDNQKGVLPDHNISLFGEIAGATIQNLTLDHANVDAAYEAGILVGEATNSKILNVVVMNSKLKVQPANNVVSLITNLGTNGGAIAGKIEDTILYNCESVNTTVYNNTTSGITGVGGERLDLGGLVGYSINSTIEYSRVRGGRVRNNYDIAVGALGGKELMTGGIVGEMNKTKVIDCFSTTDLISVGRNIVAVGSGVAGYTGGIAGVIYDEDNEIIRSHFAGTMDSYQYNAIAVIPIIQKDVNLAGLVGTNALNSSLKVENSFYRQDTLNTDDDSKVKLLGFDCNDVTNSKGLSRSEYKNKSLWKNANYDFFAEEERNTVYSSNHYNQWVMDYKLEMPIHGHSLSATFDFPDAAEVSIEKTYTDWYLDKDEDETAVSQNKTSSHSTDNPYQFAVMGYDTNQDMMTLKAETKTISGIEEAYKFVGWYKRQGKYQGDSIPELPSFFKDIISDSNRVETNLIYKLDLDDDNVQNNNDLYVAHYQAKVLLYDIDGQVINDEQYFDYQDELPEVTLTIPEGCTFYGWTTIANTDSDSNGAYIGITSNQLSDIIDADELYQTGDLIEKPMKLYPIFTNYVSNVQVIVEGHDQDDIENMSLRKNVAEAKVILDENQNIVLNVVGLENEKLPDGYRFLGWYEIDSVDDYSSQVGHRVSKEMAYTLPDDIDLTKNHYYIARFEYRVDYKVNWLEKDKNGEEDFAEIWETYKSNFEEIDGPVSYYEEVEHWGKDKLENVCSNDNCKKVTSSDLIVKPLVVWGHITVIESNSDAHTVDVSTDFPGSGKIDVTFNTYLNLQGGYYKDSDLEIEENSGYNFKFWTVEDLNVSKFSNPNKFGADISKDNPFNNTFKNTSTLGINNHYFYGRAHMTANVTFNGISNSSDSKTVERIYRDPVFLTIAKTHSYSFKADYNKTNYNYKIDNFLKAYPVESASSPSNDEMKKDGYLFLGWVDKNSITDEEFNYIYGGKVNNSTYTTDDARKAIPYLLDDSAIVTKPMDLYPVYVTTNFTTTTNIKELGITNDHPNIGLPKDPSAVIDYNSNTAYADITFTVDNNETLVLKHDSNSTMYQFKYLEYVDATGKTIRLNLNDIENKTVKVSNILLGPSYKFIAYYEPYVLTYHVSNTESQFEVRNSGDRVGQQPDALFENMDNYIFTGWTNVKPDSGNYYTSNENLTLIDSDDFVTGSMELWAVYQNAKITVTSNIDGILGNQTEITRGWRTSDNGGYELFAKETVKVGNQNYVFCGWKNNKNDSNYFTTSPNYSIDPLEEKSYIAIYEKSVTVTYHFNDKEFQKVQVVADKRSFVETIDIDGETTTSMIDTNVMQSMMDTLGKDDLFIQWQWINEAGITKDWSDFSGALIDQNMDLYPVVYHLSAKDSQDKPINDMTFVYNKGKDDSQLEPTDIYAYLSIPYTQEKLTVIVTKTSGSDFEKTQVSDKYVTLWVADENMQIDSSDDEDDKVENPYVEYDNQKTGTDGEAVFTFTGQLMITKKMSGNIESSDTFIFTLEKKVGEEFKKMEIPLTMKDNQTSITVQLPCGQYKVSEDESWAWRYKVDSDIGSVNEEGYINIIPYYSKKPREITFTNAKANDKWFNAIDHEPNVFGKGGNS